MSIIEDILILGVAQVLCNPCWAMAVLITDGTGKQAIIVTLSSVLLAIFCFLCVELMRGTL